MVRRTRCGVELHALSCISKGAGLLYALAEGGSEGRGGARAVDVPGVMKSISCQYMARTMKEEKKRR